MADRVLIPGSLKGREREGSLKGRDHSVILVLQHQIIKIKIETALAAYLSLKIIIIRAGEFRRASTPKTRTLYLLQKTQPPPQKQKQKHKGNLKKKHKGINLINLLDSLMKMIMRMIMIIGIIIIIIIIIWKKKMKEQN